MAQLLLGEAYVVHVLHRRFARPEFWAQRRHLRASGGASASGAAWRPKRSPCLRAIGVYGSSKLRTVRTSWVAWELRLRRPVHLRLRSTFHGLSAAAGKSGALASTPKAPHVACMLPACCLRLEVGALLFPLLDETYGVLA